MKISGSHVDHPQRAPSPLVPRARRPVRRARALSARPASRPPAGAAAAVGEGARRVAAASGARAGRRPAGADRWVSRRSWTQRQRAADAAQSRARRATVADLRRARLAENLRARRAPTCSAVPPTPPSCGTSRPATGPGEVAAPVYRNTGQAHSLSRLLDSRSPAEYGYHQEIAHAAGEVQMQIVQRAVVDPARRGEARGGGRPAEAPLPRAGRHAAGVDARSTTARSSAPQACSPGRSSGCPAGSRSPPA